MRLSIFLLLLTAPLLWGNYNESLCSVCEEMVTEVQTAIQSDASLELAGALLQEMCLDNLEDVALVCKFLVEGYLPSVMDITSTLAYELCPLLNLCQSYSPFQSGDQMKLSECTLCQMAAIELRRDTQAWLPSPTLTELAARNDKCREDVDSCVDGASVLFSYLLGAGARSGACNKLDSCADRSRGNRLPMGSKYCILCKVIVNQAQGSMNSVSSDSFEDMMNNLCEGLPQEGGGKDDEDLQKQCEELKDKYSDVLLEILQKVEPAALCALFNVCSSSVSARNLEHKPGQVDSNICFLCQTAFGYLTEILKDSDMDSNIVSLIEKACQTLPSGLSSQCYTFVSTYGAFLISKFGSLIGTTSLCNALPGCNNSSEWKITADTRQLISSVDVFRPEELVENNLEELTCSWCTYMVGQLAPVILNESGDYKKNRVFNNSCSLLPSNFNNINCKSCRQKYDTIITKLIKAGKHPYEICHSYIGCCRLNSSQEIKSNFDFHSAYYWIGREALAPFSSAPGHRHLLGKHKNKPPPPPPPPDQTQCMACEFLVASNYEEKHLHLPHLPHLPGHDRRELEHTCKEVPKGYKSVCESAAKKMAHTHLQKYKLHHGSPPKACSAVGQCKSKVTGRLLWLPRESQNLLLYGMQDSINTCVLCKLVAGVIAVQMKAANLTINLVEYMVQTVCNMMQKDECWEVVDSLKTIIRKVGQYVDPADVCVNTGFCSGVSSPLLPPVPLSYPSLDA
ncbi:Prosaposin-like isoform X1 [Oopsacas minuta]|uniref:Prosaposin-like isoform X1 n=1 Tax=Oopsacas minuta TaxID=111878 RepID=A0AAV7JN31_9METZ|nr:Prosaposin-like isoform X1 [Oopsacas minuta]